MYAPHAAAAAVTVASSQLFVSQLDSLIAATLNCCRNLLLQLESKYVTASIMHSMQFLNMLLRLKTAV